MLESKKEVLVAYDMPHSILKKRYIGSLGVVYIMYIEIHCLPTTLEIVFVVATWEIFCNSKICISPAKLLAIYNWASSIFHAEYQAQKNI